MPFHLPTKADTNEYYSPPLPYLIPSIAGKICHLIIDTSCDPIAGKVAQILNVFLSVGITIIFLKLSDLLKPNDRVFKLSALLMLGIETVYYRTFSQVRGEPYVAFFVTSLIYLLLILAKNYKTLTAAFGAKLGIVMGLLILSRQWGILSFSAIGILFLAICFHQKSIDWNLTKILALAGVVAFFVGGWFYISLWRTYDSITSFSLESSIISINGGRG